MRNNSGPKDAPCGTPHTRYLKFESEPLLKQIVSYLKCMILLNYSHCPADHRNQFFYTKYHGLLYQMPFQGQLTLHRHIYLNQ